MHRLSDLDAVGDRDSHARALAKGLLGDCSTKIIYQQETSEAAHTASLLGLTTAERAQLPDLQRGEGLWHVGQHAFVVRHVTTPDELTLFDTNQTNDAVSEPLPHRHVSRSDPRVQSMAAEPVPAGRAVVAEGSELGAARPRPRGPIATDWRA